jgi:uncharacterized protein
MSRSDLPRSSIVARLRQNSSSLARPSTPHAHAIRRKLSIRFAKWMRWLHIYLSMFSLAAVLFFSLTGITLNHPDWAFGQVERKREAKGQVDLKWVGRNTGAGEAQALPVPDPSNQVAKLEVVEYLRKTYAIRGALAEFRVDDNECVVSFKGPGYSADTFIDRESGEYSLTELDHGLIALINDLHKGRDTGPAWSLVIDLSAGLMTLISLTGLVLLFYLKLRRIPGLLVALAGTIVLLLIFRLWVP